MQSIDEGLRRDIHHPSHRDNSPLAVLPVIMVAGAALVVLWSLAIPVWLAVVWTIVAVLGGIATVAVLLRALRRRTDRARAEVAERRRTDSRSEERRRIAEARARGAFARWEAEGTGRDDRPV